MIARLTARNEWKFFAVLPPSRSQTRHDMVGDPAVRGALPAVFAIAMGVVIRAIENDDDLAGPLTLMGVVFVALQVLAPIHQSISANLGSRASTYLHDRLMRACVQPPGMAHLEKPALTNDLTMARDFDIGIVGPPLAIAMDFIAVGLVDLVSGCSQAIVLVGYRWWAPLVLGGAWDRGPALAAP